MAPKITTSLFKSPAAWVAAAVMVFLAGWLFFNQSKTGQQYYTIGVFYNSVNSLPEDIEVIQFVVGKKVAEINREGGIGGRSIQIRYLDDKGSREVAYQQVKQSLNDKNLIAYLGSWGSSRVQAVAGLVGKSGVPYIGGYSVTSIAAAYPNMYSYEIGVNQVAFVTQKLLQARSKKNIAFIANSNDVYSIALLSILKQQQQQQPGYQLVMEKWYPNEHKFKPSELKELVDSLQQQADFLVLSTNPGHTNTVLAELGKQAANIPVLTAFTDIPEIDPEITGFGKLELYDISIFGIPSALNMRCQELEAKYKKELGTDSRLQFQLGLGGLHADAIGLLHAASKVKESEADLLVREKINQGLTEYINGKRLYKGWFSDWYFSHDRALVNEVLLGWKPPHILKPVLYPTQFLRTDSGLQQAPVLYTNIDLMELNRISESDQTFDASFFLEINTAAPVTLEQIDFVNAVRNEVDQKPLLAIKPLQVSERPDAYGLYHYLYRIRGKFYFKPDLKRYPFDEQRFSITMQTNSALQPFLMQPPGQQNSDTDFSSPGWRYKNHFVGFDQDVIYAANQILPQQRHLPYYKFSYTYVLNRTRIDFFLKILIPLLALLIITYLSVYVPIREFVPVVTMQVIALLSAIALYFSVYKPAMASATISDKIFIFTYIMITTLIGATILQYWLYRRRRSRRRLSIVVSVYEMVLFPVIVVGFTLFLIF